MNLFNGILYNLRGMWLGIKTPKLLFLGLIRFFAVIILTILSASLLLVYHQEILHLIWSKPEAKWVFWLWYLFSWLLSFFLAALAAVFSYVLSQILFSVMIMDHMSEITEQMIFGHIKEPGKRYRLRQFFYLIRQEIPRTTLPVLFSLLLMILGWLTPFGPVITALSTSAAIIFLAWDNTDLVSARRQRPFGRRFKFLLKTLPFHFGFGLLFLIPGLNILSLSFAPVGATLYYAETHGGEMLPG